MGMSDYSRTKAVFYPIDDNAKSQCEIENAWGLQEKYPNAFLKDKFEIEVMADYDGDGACRYYLTYPLYHTYGDESGDFGRTRDLTDNEQLKYANIFGNYFPDLNIDSTKFKYIDYCYYNCSECEDYYIRPIPDDFNKEI